MNAPTLIAALVAVIALCAAGWYRFRHRLLLHDHYCVLSFLTKVLLADKDDHAESIALFEFIKNLPAAQRERLMAAVNLYLTKRAVGMFQDVEARKDAGALLLGINAMDKRIDDYL